MASLLIVCASSNHGAESDVRVRSLFVSVLVVSVLVAVGSGATAPLALSRRALVKSTDATHVVPIDGYSITTECSGRSRSTRPAVILLAGEGDPLSRLASVQRGLSGLTVVCSYDRLGEGASSAPRTDQTPADSAAILHGLLLKLHLGSHGVVLVGHSLGGLIAAEYASKYRSGHEVRALVLLDATPTGIVRRIERLIPPGTGGVAGRGRSEIVGLATGRNPERLVVGRVRLRSIGRVPVIVVQHGRPIFATVPIYGQRIQQIWSEGQRNWLHLSARAHMVIARRSAHYIYLDQLALTLRLIRQALAEAA